MVPSSPARSSWRQTVKGTPEWHHTTYPRTDWQSGPWVTLKNGLKVAVESGVSAERALARFLLAYRSSPHAATGRAPAELLYGRNQRTRLNLLIPCAETRCRPRGTINTARLEDGLGSFSLKQQCGCARTADGKSGCAAK